jgi:hypothetical protein
MNKTTICGISLYDMMAEDFNVWLGKNSKFGYDLHIEGYDNDSPLIEDESIHPCAIDSFAEFCRRFVSQYDRLQTKEAA